MAKEDNFRIDFIDFPSENPISFSVFDSDMAGNLVVMEQLVGTLVKYSGTARYEPFLAKSWTASEDLKTWTFELQENLTTEDGEKIDAESFALSFKKLLKIYAETYSPPTFNRLVGWDEFIKGNDTSFGIHAASKYQLVLSFQTTPSGLLEFLSMPGFGYYSKANFDGNKWRNQYKIFSSALYKVSKHSAAEVVLEVRKDWPIVNSELPKELVFRQIDYKKVLNEKRNFIIKLSDNSQIDGSDFVKFSSPPTLLRSLVVSPLIYPFDSLEIRKAFKIFIHAKSLEFNYIDSTSEKTSHFYNVFSSFPLEDGNYQEAVEALKDLKLKTLSIFKYKFMDNNENKYLEFLLSSIQKDLGWKLQIETPETIGSDYIQKISTNKNYQLRVARVDAGGSPENWIIDMMFCSTLGISFPDSDGSICKIVKKYDKGDYLDKMQYWKDLHSAIESQSAVIPLALSGVSWLISSTIDTSGLPTTMSVPRFDQLK